jgi:hypothetical protein
LENSHQKIREFWFKNAYFMANRCKLDQIFLQIYLHTLYNDFVVIVA